MKIIKFSALAYNKFYQQYTIFVIVPNANIAGTEVPLNNSCRKKTLAAFFSVSLASYTVCCFEDFTPYR